MLFVFKRWPFLLHLINFIKFKLILNNFTFNLFENTHRITWPKVNISFVASNMSIFITCIYTLYEEW